MEKPGLLILAGAARLAHFIEADAFVKRAPGPVGEQDTRAQKHHRYEEHATTAIVPCVPPPPNPNATRGRGERKEAKV